MKIVCCTYYSPSHKELADICLPNLFEYCSRHGYYMWVENIENDKWEYVKHETFKVLFEKEFDVIWYRDIDSVITNMSATITDFIDDEHDFFITKDFNELNGGSVIIKNNKFGRWFNSAILNLRGDFNNEQNCINGFYKFKKVANHIKVLSHPSINSYHYDLYPECKDCVGREDWGDWKEGNFVLHVPALSMEQRIKTLRQAKIIR